MLKRGNIITFEDFKTAIVDLLIDVCSNVNSSDKDFPYTLEDNRVVKEWTKTFEVRVEPIDVYKKKQDPYYIKKSNTYKIVQHSNIKSLYKNYTRAEVSRILENVYIANNVDSFTGSVLYMSMFTHLIKILSKFIVNNFCICVSLYYNDKRLFFAPTNEYEYNLTQDISHDGDDAYDKSLILTYLKNLSLLIIYSIPQDNIKFCTYDISIEKNVDKPVEKDDIDAEFTNFDFNRASVLSYASFDIVINSAVNDFTFEVLYKTDMTYAWTKLGTAKKGDNKFSIKDIKTTTKYYFQIIPADTETNARYNKLGKNNKFGYIATKSSEITGSHTELVTERDGPMVEPDLWYIILYFFKQEHPDGWCELELSYGCFYVNKYYYKTVYDHVYVWSGKYL